MCGSKPRARDNNLINKARGNKKNKKNNRVTDFFSLMEYALITGGLGYIGSHTITQLKKYEIIIVDNLSNSKISTLNALEIITGKKIIFYDVDICEHQQNLEHIFKNHKINMVIHFAALKSVADSVRNPLKYYRNNILSTINLLMVMIKFQVNNLVFSSSCSVYGNACGIVTEETPFGKAQSPYAQTKQICEQIIESSDIQNKIILRYFNPVGVHPSLLLGEDTSSTSLVPIIVRGENIKVFGGDYSTKDGTPVRDYIHIMDIAQAHIKAMERLYKVSLRKPEIYNLGSGKPSTVLEVISAFEKVSDQKCTYEIVNRRVGDVDAVFADISLAFLVLRWKPSYSLDEMILSYWKYYSLIKDQKR